MAVAAVILLSVALAVAVVGILLMYLMPAPCKCDHCGFHIHERAEAKATQLRENAERAHDMDHKGPGYHTGDPDIYHCSNEDCARNARRVN